jgi:hypothetical protein
MYCDCLNNLKTSVFIVKQMWSLRINRNKIKADKLNIIEIKIIILFSSDEC